MTTRIVITDHSFQSLDFEREFVTSRDVELDFIDAVSESDVLEAVAGADAILNTNAPITRNVFEAAGELQVVGRYGIGVDTVDLDAATDHSVQVVNVASYCEEEVSTHALALLLSVVRRTSAYDREVRDGQWDWMAGTPMQRLADKTVGFAGFGKIAQRLLTKMEGFDVDFIAYDPYQTAEEIADLGATKVSFDEFVETVDIASVHAPLTEETRDLFDEPVFERMDDSAIVVNTSRGDIVDVESLCEAVDQGKLYGAGLDVLPSEPPNHESLPENPRVIYTPHVGWYSESSVTELRETAISDVLRVLQGDCPENPVNDPERGPRTDN